MKASVGLAVKAIVQCSIGRESECWISSESECPIDSESKNATGCEIECNTCVIRLRQESHCAQSRLYRGKNSISTQPMGCVGGAAIFPLNFPHKIC